MPAEQVAAFAPGRVNVIGEHTDYNGGLALPFAIDAGVTVRARVDGGDRVRARALDLGESDEFPLSAIVRVDGWRAYVRGVVAELAGAGFAPRSCELEISSSLPQGAGLSSSAALTVALCTALLALAGTAGTLDALELARLCARVEREWAGADTGLLDELASLCGAVDSALLIDFTTLTRSRVPLALDGWRFVLLDSGERHAHGSSGYNERRAECRRACELLGVDSLRSADRDAAAALPEPLARRALHVLDENERVLAAAAALGERRLGRLGSLLDESHASLRDLYEVSTPAVERVVEALRSAGAAGARIMGGGFGGAVLGLLPPGLERPPSAVEVAPGAGAHLL